MSLSFSRDGTVLETTEFECRARRSGMCHICGEVKTHEKEKKGFLKYEWRPLTVLSGGCYEVYKGYCLHPRCYTLKQAKRALGEDKAIDRRRRRSHNDRPEASSRVLQDTSYNGVSSSSMCTSSSSLGTADVVKATHANGAASESITPPGLHASSTTLETASISSRSHESTDGVPIQSMTASFSTAEMLNSIRCIEASVGGEEAPKLEEKDWEWDSAHEINRQNGINKVRENDVMTATCVRADVHSSGSPADNVVTVSEIKALIAQIGGNVECAVEVLVNFMESNPDAEAIQAHCLGTIISLSKNNESNKDVIMASGALDKILSAMSNYSSSASVQERACTALWSLAVKREHRLKLTHSDAGIHILNALEQHSNEKCVAERAIGALLTFSSEAEFRVDLRMQQAKKLVLQAMKSHSEGSSIQRDGCILLSNIAVDLNSHEIAIVSQEEIEAVLQAIENHKSDPPVILGACFALTNFIHNEQNLTSADELQRVMSVLDDVSKEVQDEEAKHALTVALYELHARRAANESIEDTVSSSLIKKVRHAGNDDNIGFVLKIMRDYKWSEKVTCSGLQCFWLVINELSVNRDYVIDGRIIQETISAMGRQTSCPNVQEKGCEVLECLARGDAVERSSIVQAGGSRAIVAAIREHQENERVQRSAFEALYMLSDNFECWFDIEQDGSIDDIKQAVEKHQNSAVVQRTGRSILSNFNAQSCRF